MCRHSLLQRPVTSQKYPADEGYTRKVQHGRVGGNTGCYHEELKWDRCCCQTGCALTQSVHSHLEQSETTRPSVATQSALTLPCEDQQPSLLSSVDLALENFDQSTSFGYTSPQFGDLPPLNEFARVASAVQDVAFTDISDTSLAATLDLGLFSNPDFSFSSASAFPASLGTATSGAIEWSELSPLQGLNPFDLS